MNPLLEASWIQQLEQFSTLWVGYSGGRDSSVLLHALAAQPSLLPRLRAIHINHGLSPYASSWQTHCEHVCRLLSIPFQGHVVSVSASANIEEQARLARYQVFRGVMGDQVGLVLAHHQTDQAETLLLHLLRGAGIDGLAAMLAAQPFAGGSLLRPLLSCSVEQIESYARLHQLQWMEDDSNQHEAFSRNFLRHRILPLLQTKWPAAAKTLARAAEHCQQAQHQLYRLAVMDCPELQHPSTVLRLKDLNALPRDRVLNVLGVWLKNNQLQRPSARTLNRLIDELILARADAMPEVTWGNVSIRRYRQQLHCMMVSSAPVAKRDWDTFPASLQLGGNLGTLKAYPAAQGFRPPKGARIEVRFRQGGETFHWHGQTKLLKQLMQQWSVPPWLRGRIPLIYMDGILVVVVGYAVTDQWIGEAPSSMGWQVSLQSENATEGS